MQEKLSNPFKNLHLDAPASIVVFLVALPLCLAVASASGVQPFAGIIAGAVGGIVIGILSKSPLSVSGPAAGLTVIVLGATKLFPDTGTLLLVFFLAGVLQFILGLIRAGVIGYFIPDSVIKGMLAAIGLILILKQIPHAVGYDKDYEGDFNFEQPDGRNTFSEIWHLMDEKLTLGAIIISLVSLIFLFWWDASAPKRRGFLRLLPGPIIVVVFGVLANWFFKLYTPDLAIVEQEHLVNIPVPDSGGGGFSGWLNAFFGQFSTLSFAGIGNIKVWTTAATIAAVASIETLLCIEAVDKIDPYKRVSPTNRELLAQGTGNMLCGLIGGMPMTSVIVRSSANVNAGARTQASTILHGVLLIVSAAAIPGLLNLIPFSALAAVLIATGYKLTKPALYKSEFNKGWSHFIPLVVTVIAILFTDLLIGVLIGIGVGAAFTIIGNFQSAIRLEQDENGNYLVSVRKDLSFIHKYELKRVLYNIPDGAHVWINLNKANFVDLDNAEIIKDFIESAVYRDIVVELRGLHDTNTLNSVKRIKTKQ
ncbi:MAG: SulP family inorganic anion transporter [Chitinophagales bacterium]|nr:SulP family inorganic anion transporter [Chitinophagales bacterium]